LRLEALVARRHLLRPGVPWVEALEQGGDGHAAHREPRGTVHELAAAHRAVNVLIVEIEQLGIEIGRLLPFHDVTSGASDRAIYLKPGSSCSRRAGPGASSSGNQRLGTAGGGGAALAAEPPSPHRGSRPRR